MRRIVMKLQYDGTDYRGWQIQSSGTTIQGVLEECVHRITGESVSVIGAGRTDAGVHAIAQIAVFDSSSHLPGDVLKRAINALLPHDIRVLDLFDADRGFHPRYDATRKRYVYLIANTDEMPVFFERYVWWIKGPLDTEAMRTASSSLIGRHDYSSFRATGCSARNPVREVFLLDVGQADSTPFLALIFPGKSVKITIEAEGFLRHMVRNIVGTLVEVGRGRLRPEEVKDILERCDRKEAGPAAPARGLFLEKVLYFL